MHVAVCGAAGIDPDGEQAFHVWTLIHEIPEGNWAGGGKVIYSPASQRSGCRRRILIESTRLVSGHGHLLRVRHLIGHPGAC